MSGTSYLAIVVATGVAFGISMVWYGAFGKPYAELLAGYRAAGAGPAAGARPPAWKLLVELARSLAVAAVLAGAATGLELDNLGQALLLGLVAWIGFPAAILTGSAIWDGVPWRLAAIHAGDWLVKLLVVAGIVGVWR